MQQPDHKTKSGFTLIEISIVLVIIGLIVGGVLVGQDLINAAAIRAQISQIEKYNTAVHTFQSKYGYLPGDIPDPYASNFGFQARGANRAQGDGNGAIEGVSDTLTTFGGAEAEGETTVFWVDLSTAGLMDGSFNTASTITAPGGVITATSTPSLNAYFPNAKIGNNNYVSIYSGGLGSNYAAGDGCNYFSVSSIINIGTLQNSINTGTALTVQQAYNIDKKIDDGFPQSGNVTAFYNNYAVPHNGQIAWSAGGGNFGADAGAPYWGSTTAATAGSATTCYDNSSASSGTPGVAGAVQHYSLEMSGGNNLNCALSFKFQ